MGRSRLEQPGTPRQKQPGTPRQTPGTLRQRQGAAQQRQGAAQLPPGSAPRLEKPDEPGSPPSQPGTPMFKHMFREVSFTDVRRRSLTLVDVLSEMHTVGKMKVHRIVIAVAISWMYWTYLLPMVSSWGTERWAKQVSLGLYEPSYGGPGADVHWAVLVLITMVYLCFVFFGVRYMERRPPAQKRIFEWLVVYNATQALLNLRLVFALLGEAWGLFYPWPWGNTLDASEKGYKLGMLIWFQYHCRQLDLMDTVFMILRKTFQRISLVHVYLRLLNLWGWFIACRFAAGGDTYFPAVVHAACQVLVYLYYTIHMIQPQGVKFFRKANVAEVQVAQFMIVALHAAFVLLYGNIPRWVAAFNLFIMANALIFYIDFDDEHPRLGPRSTLTAKQEGYGHEKLTFCFDSSGWLYCYHFGVAHWIQEHMLSNITHANATTDAFPKSLAFSGSSGGSLVAGALGSGINVAELFDYVLTWRDYCKRNPVRLFRALQFALNKYLPKDCDRSMSGRVRVLLSRVGGRPPFLTGEIVDQYESYDEAWHTLRASCHIPVVYFKPYKLNDRYYFDGLLWSSFFVPWVSDDSLTVRVSAISRPTTDIRAPLQPIWWALFPPPVEVLRGMFWTGYRDAERFFSAPPVDPLDPCRCRRSIGNPQDGDQAAKGPNQVAKFNAAQKLMTKPCADLPLIDPVTGVDVSEYLRAHTSAVRWNCGLLLVMVLVLILSLLAAIWYNWHLWN